MGQKINPKGFRLITTQKYISNFYNSKFAYSTTIKDDFEIRNKIENFLKKNFIKFSTIEINRTENNSISTKYVHIIINLLYPRKKQANNLIAMYLSNFEENNEIKNLILLKYKALYRRSNLSISRLKIYIEFLFKRYLKKLLYFFKLINTKEYLVSIKFKKSEFEDSSLIAKYIAEELQKRIKFRRILKIALKRVLSIQKHTKIIGLKIKLSGRLNGIEIARKEWKREGSLPLHTLNAIIDYSSESVNTIYGTIGIKVWLYKGLL